MDSVYLRTQAAPDIALVGILLSALGCSAPSPKASTTLQEGEGLVAVRVSPSKQGLGIVLVKWGGLVMRSVESGATFSLAAIDSSLAANSSMFIAALPSGTYEPLELDATQGSAYMESARAPLMGAIGTFEVKPGQLTNLGTIVYVQDPQTTGTFRLGLVEGDDTPARVAREIAPAAFSGIGDAHTLGWSSLVAVDRLHAVALLGRSSGTGLSAPWPLEAKVFAVGANYGQIHVRIPGGPTEQVTARQVNARWIQLDTGAVDRVLTVVALAPASIAVGGEHGLLMISGDRGTSWRQVSSPTALGHIVLLHQVPGVGIVLVAEAWDAVSVYRGSLDDERWTEIGRYNISGRLSAGKFSRPFVAARGSDMLIGMPHGLLTHLDLSTGTARTLETTGICASFSSDGAVYALGPAYRQAPLRRSRDHANTWEQVAVLSLPTGCPAFLDPSTAYLTRLDRDMRLSRTSDGGAAWTDLSPLPIAGFTPFLGVVDDDAIFAVYPAGAIFGSRDRGSTWTRER